MQFLTFRIARQDFIMDASRVRAMMGASEVAPVDSPVPWMIGVASTHGQEFPVLDLRRKLDLPAGSQGRMPCVVAVQTGWSEGPRLIGFIADSVSQVLTLSPRDFQSGAVRISGRMRRMLDPDAIISEQEFFSLICPGAQPLMPSSA